VGRLFDLRRGAVTTSVAGGGGTAGNITVGNPSFLILEGSGIRANAFGGPGGNITIRAGQLVRSPDSVIEASSARSVSGTIVVTAPNAEIGSTLVVLPESFLDASSLLVEACAGRGDRPSSTLVQGGRGGMPPDPAARLASPLALPIPAEAPGHRAAAPRIAPEQAPRVLAEESVCR
jgi:large exoprotein involved in heme utilization and adhesion